MYNETHTIDLNNKKVKKVTENNFEQIKEYLLNILLEVRTIHTVQDICLEIQAIHNAHNIKNTKISQVYENLIEEFKKLLVYENLIEEFKKLLNKYIKNLTSYELYNLEIYVDMEYYASKMMCFSSGIKAIDVANADEIFGILMKSITLLPDYHQEEIDLIKSMSMEISHQSIQMSLKAAFLIEPNLSRLSSIDRITIPNIYIEVIEILKYHDQNIQIDVIYEGHLKLGKFKTSNKDTPIIGIYPKDNDISTIVGIEGMYRTDCYIENNVSTYVKGTYAKRKSTKLSSSIELLIHLRYVAKQEQQYYEARYALQNTKERIKYKDIPIGERIPNRYTNVF